VKESSSHNKIEKEEAKPLNESSKVTKPTYLVQGGASQIEEQISALRNRIAALEARVRYLEIALQKQSMMIEPIWTNFQSRAKYPQTPKDAVPGAIIGFTKTANNKYVFSANGATIEIDQVGNIVIETRMNISIDSDATTTMKSSALKLGGSSMMLESGADMHINSKLLRINNGNRPVARQGDEVKGICPPHGGILLNGTIKEGALSTVLVP